MPDAKVGSSSGREPRRQPRHDKAATKKPGTAAPPDAEWDKLSQREKFIRTARELGCDETGEKLDEALRAVGRARRR